MRYFILLLLLSCNRPDSNRQLCGHVIRIDVNHILVSFDSSNHLRHELWFYVTKPDTFKINKKICLK